jgi:two-component system response regulator AtoC
MAFRPERVTQVAVEDRLASIIIGNSSAMHNVRHLVRQVSLYPETTVLLQGESGTGKEVIATAIHQLSHPASAPFVPINCAAIPGTLLETELFGVVAGAFTDAHVSRDGYLLRAHKGTLFLDEISSMQLALQAKLLRFLETRTFLPVGGTKEIHVKLRVISATNVDLQEAVAKRVFREDLFYRLNVITIVIPSLRDRSEDIVPLVEHFLRLDNGPRSEPFRMGEDALELLQRYAWPGNVRELRSVIEYSKIICDSDTIHAQDLPEVIWKAPTSAAQRLREIQQHIRLPPEGIDLLAFLSAIEHTFIQEALAYCDSNQVHAAALLGISRDQLRYRLQRLRTRTRLQA